MASSRSPLPAMWQVPQVFRQRLRESVGRQRAMECDGHLLLILHAPPKADQPGREARFFWRSPEGTWRATFGSGVAALQKHIAEFDAAIERLDEAEDAAERAMEYFDILQEISPLRRAARHLHEVLQEAREKAPDDGELIVCRDLAYAVQRRAELVENDTQSGLNYLIARRAEEQAENSFKMVLSTWRLNVLAAVFFPVATVATVFGMNLRHGLELGPLEPWLFWAIVATSMAAGFMLKAALIDRPAAPERAAGRQAGGQKPAPSANAPAAGRR